MFSSSYVYIYRKKRSKEFATLGTCTSRGAARVRAPGRDYAVGLEGNVGRKRPFKDALKRARALMKRHPDRKVTFRAFDKDGQQVDQVRFATLQKSAPVADTPGVEGIDRFVGWLESEVSAGRLTSRRYAGICVCKTTSSGGHSDHADCAAIDVFASERDMEAIRDAILANAEYFHVKYVILYDRIWFADDSSKPYTGTYHLHVHLSVTGGIPGSAC